MPQVDPSIPLQAQAPKFDPLQATGQYAEIANALTNLQANQQQLRARTAIGPIYQQSIGQNGELDTNKLLQLAAGNPDTAFMAGDLAKAAQERRQQQLSITGSELDQAHKRFDAMNGVLSSLFTKPSLSQSDVFSAGAQLIRSGMFNGADGKPDPQAVQSLVGELQTAPQDPAQLRPWVQSHLIQTMDAQQKFTAMYGSPTQVNTGAKTEMGSFSPMTGYHPAGSFDMTMTPGQKTEGQPAFVNGQPGIVPKGQLYDDKGNLRGAGVAGPGGFIATGPKLGESEAAGVTAQASAGQGIDLQKRADTTPTNKALLGQMEGVLAHFTPGPGADLQHTLGALAQQYGVPWSGNGRGVAAQEEFVKLSNQIAQSQFSALGGTGTDSKLESARHTSPDQMLSKMGNLDIIHLLKGNEDAIAAKNDAWQRWISTGHSASSYGEFSSKFNKSYDPRVFQSVYMSPDQVKDMVRGMTPAEHKAFEQNYKAAYDRGWIH